MVAWAAAEETPLEILGAGTKRGLRAAGRGGAQVALDGLAGIGLYEPAELVMSARAGTPLAEIEAQLAENHQQLAFEPPDYGALWAASAGAARSAACSPAISPARAGSRPGPRATTSSASRRSPGAAI